MGKFIKIELDENQKEELENGYRNDKIQAFCLRCRMILLKNERWRSCDIANILSCSEQSVNFWVQRYKAEGICGLQTRSDKR